MNEDREVVTIAVCKVIAVVTSLWNAILKHEIAFEYFCVMKTFATWSNMEPLGATAC